MPDLLVRGVRDEVKSELVGRAARNGRSVQAEARRILEEAVIPPTASRAFSERDDESARRARAGKRAKLFQALDALNARENLSRAPHVADMVAAARAEADDDDGRTLALLEGGMA